MAPLCITPRSASGRAGCIINKKHLNNVGPIHHCEPPHANSPYVASGTVVARRLRIDVHDDIDNDDNDNDNAFLLPVSIKKKLPVL